MTTQPPLTQLLVPLTQPRWVAGASVALLCIAAWAIVMSALWIGLDTWLAYFLATIPFLVHFIERWSKKAQLKDRILVVYSDKPWQLAFFSTDTSLTDRIEVIVSQRWHHIFGLSLGLKFQNRPHNKTQTVIVVVWRQCLSPTAFHAVALEAARQLEGVGRHSKGDAA